MDFFKIDNLGFVTSFLSFFGFGFLSLSDRLKIKHQAVTRTVQIRDALHLADFEVRKLLTLEKDYKEELFKIATKILSPNLDKFAVLYKQGMLDRFLASRMAIKYYNSILIEVSYFAINSKFDFYTVADWVNIKQKTKKEKKDLINKKNAFLQEHFPDFYDIHYSLKHNPVSYTFKALHFIFNDSPTWLIKPLIFKNWPTRLIEKHWMPICIKDYWNKVLIFVKKFSISKWLKSFFYINNLSDVFTMFVVPLVPPFFISLGVYVLFLYLKA